MIGSDLRKVLRWARDSFRTVLRDLCFAIFLVKVMAALKWLQWRNMSVPKVFRATARRVPDKVMFYFEDEKWTFKEVDEYSDRVAKVFLDMGYGKNDTVGIFLGNRPEYVAIWLGLSKIGAISALINCNQKSKGLIHAIKAAECKAIVYGAEFAREIAEVHQALVPVGSSSSSSRSSEDRDASSTTHFPTFCTGLAKTPGSSLLPEIGGTIDLDRELSLMKERETNGDLTVPDLTVLEEVSGFTDRLYYIYTSGTTGLPKAAIINHSRFLVGSYGTKYTVGLVPNDVLYSPLPLYHSAAGLLFMSICFNFGTSLVIRKKFSATNYWKDCVTYRCTVCQYIGEICRYLLSSPKCPEESQHSVRCMIGNGMRPQIWTRFKERFAIPRIAEFYSSTEGNTTIVNSDNVVGSIGFVPLTFGRAVPFTLIKIDQVSGKPVRGEDGLCIKCKPGEPGELVGKIVKNHPVREFRGYKDVSSTKDKVLENVASVGDRYFRSGDIMVMDEMGWLYFRDRSGDTFRWKGENVSTNEVEAIVSDIVHMKDAAVYGVEVPGTEGKAGMASIHDPNGEIDLDHLAKGLAANLPSYARPLFLRLTNTWDITGTFKHRKVDLQKEGFDLDLVAKAGDRLFFFRSETGKYVPLTKDLHTSITDGFVKL